MPFVFIFLFAGYSNSCNRYRGFYNENRRGNSLYQKKKLKKTEECTKLNRCRSKEFARDGENQWETSCRSHVQDNQNTGVELYVLYC